MASVSARVRFEGGEGFVEVCEAAMGSAAGNVSELCGTAFSGGLVVVVVVVSGACAVVFAASDAVPDGGSVLISTGLEDSSSWVVSLRTPCAACGGLLCAGVDG